MELLSSKQASLQLLARLGGETSGALSITSVAVQLVVVNRSSHAVASGGKWAVKDESVTPPVVQEAMFDRIAPGGEQERYAHLPSGFEWGAFKFVAEDGSGTWASIHGGNDTEAVRLTLGD